MDREERGGEKETEEESMRRHDISCATSSRCGSDEPGTEAWSCDLLSLEALVTRPSYFLSQFQVVHYGAWATMKSLFFAGLCAVLSITSSLAASPQEQLAQLAAAGNGVIKLDATTYDLLMSPKREWSASVQLTALDPRRRCSPCKSGHSI